MAAPMLNRQQSLRGQAATSKDLADAARSGNAEELNLMMEIFHLDPNEVSEYGGTAICHAAAAGTTSCAEILLIHGAAIDAETSGGQTALFLACEKSKVDTAAFLIANGANLNKTDQHGRTSLHVCCVQGVSPSVQLLVNSKANMEIKDKEGNTPLILAARYGRLECVKLLVAAGASLTATNDAGHKAVDAARHGGCKSTEDYLIEAELDQEEASA